MIQSIGLRLYDNCCRPIVKSPCIQTAAKIVLFLAVNSAVFFATGSAFLTGVSIGVITYLIGLRLAKINRSIMRGEGFLTRPIPGIPADQKLPEDFSTWLEAVKNPPTIGPLPPGVLRHIIAYALPDKLSIDQTRSLYQFSDNYHGGLFKKRPGFGELLAHQDFNIRFLQKLTDSFIEIRALFDEGSKPDFYKIFSKRIIVREYLPRHYGSDYLYKPFEPVIVFLYNEANYRTLFTDRLEHCRTAFSNQENQVNKVALDTAEETLKTFEDTVSKLKGFNLNLKGPIEDYTYPQNIFWFPLSIEKYIDWASKEEQAIINGQLQKGHHWIQLKNT